MKVKSIDGFVAHCEAKGVERDLNLLMIQDVDVEVGDFLVGSLGYAMQKVTQAEAEDAWALLDEILEDPRNLGGDAV